MKAKEKEGKWILGSDRKDNGRTGSVCVQCCSATAGGRRGEGEPGDTVVITGLRPAAAPWRHRSTTETWFLLLLVSSAVFDSVKGVFISSHNVWWQMAQSKATDSPQTWLGMWCHHYNHHQVIQPVSGALIPFLTYFCLDHRSAKSSLHFIHIQLRKTFITAQSSLINRSTTCDNGQ